MSWRRGRGASIKMCQSGDAISQLLARHLLTLHFELFLWEILIPFFEHPRQRSAHFTPFSSLFSLVGKKDQKKNTPLSSFQPFSFIRSLPDPMVFSCIGLRSDEIRFDKDHSK